MSGGSARAALLCAVCATLACGQAGARAPLDPSGVWVGQHTATGGNEAWYVTMTLAVRGAEARGIFEWIDLAAHGQTFTAFTGSWSAEAGELQLDEAVLFEELEATVYTDPAHYVISLSDRDPDAASFTNRSVGGHVGGGYLTRVCGIGDTTSLAGRWQSLPGLTNPALSVTLLANDAGFAGSGTYLDRDARVALPVALSARPVPGKAGSWDASLTVGDEGGAPTTAAAELDGSGCALRLTAGDGSVAILVRRGPPPPSEDPTTARGARAEH